MHKRIYTFLLIASISLSVPFISAATAHGQSSPDSTTANSTSWISRLLGWHGPLAGFTGYFSTLFETRQDNVQDNSMERDQLLTERKTMTPFGTASTSLLDPNAYFIASSSPSAIPSDVYEAKKAFIVTQLTTAVNGLETSRSELSDFIDHSNMSAGDKDTAENSLTGVDVNIESAHDAVTALVDYEPIASTTLSPSALVDLSIPQSDLSTAISAIDTARASLRSVIAFISNPQEQSSYDGNPRAVRAEQSSDEGSSPQ